MEFIEGVLPYLMVVGVLYFIYTRIQKKKGK